MSIGMLWPRTSVLKRIHDIVYTARRQVHIEQDLNLCKPSSEGLRVREYYLELILMDQSRICFLPSGTFIWEASRESFNLFCGLHGCFPEAVFKIGEDYRKVYDDDVADFMFCSDLMTKTVRGYGTVVFVNENVVYQVKTTTSNKTLRKGEDLVDVKTIPGPKWMIIDGLESWLRLRTASTVCELKDATFEDYELLEYFENFQFIPEIELVKIMY